MEKGKKKNKFTNIYKEKKQENNKTKLIKILK